MKLTAIFGAVALVLSPCLGLADALVVAPSVKTHGTTNGTNHEDSTGSNDSVGLTRTIPLHAVITQVLATESTGQDPFTLAGQPEDPTFTYRGGPAARNHAGEAFQQIARAWCTELSVWQRVAKKSYLNQESIEAAVKSALYAVEAQTSMPAMCQPLFGEFEVIPADPQVAQGLHVAPPVMSGYVVSGRGDNSSQMQARVNYAQAMRQAQQQMLVLQQTTVYQNIWNIRFKNGQTYRMDASPTGFTLRRGGLLVYGDAQINGETLQLALAHTKDSTQRTTRSKGSTTSTSTVH